jgi:hypothetical protein
VPLISTTGEQFWKQGLACPVYHAGPDSTAKMMTRKGYWTINRDGHPWVDVYALKTLPIDYVEQHGKYES